MDKHKHRTILAIGFAKWRGCDPRALAQSFRGLGHALIEIDAEDYIPWRWNNLFAKVFRKFFINALVRDYNNEILRIAHSSIFDFILVFKGKFLTPGTLVSLRKLNRPIYNFYPDVSFTDHGPLIAKSIKYYDCVFTTKSYHGANEIEKLQIRELQYVRHGFDPEVHRPMKLTAEQMALYGSDVTFVGCWSADKERTIMELLNFRKSLKVLVYGIGWKRADPAFINALGSNLRPGVFGDELAIAYSAAKINLGLLSSSAGDDSLSDETTARTFQIPAAGAFMLHEDTPEIRTLFTPDEVMVFTDRNDLLQKVDSALANCALRDTIRLKGHERCVGVPYDYSAAAKSIIDKYSIDCGGVSEKQR